MANIDKFLLGVNYATANYKLHRMLLFHLAKKLGLNYCYHCGYRIETVEDLSIEHTTPWRSAENPVETFYDLDKIGFSHIRCNVRDGSRISAERNRNRVTCRRGHSVNDENTYISLTGVRKCRLCANLAARSSSG